jgi:fibronectin-binding autotransporter adhesin
MNMTKVTTFTAAAKVAATRLAKCGMHSLVCAAGALLAVSSASAADGTWSVSTGAATHNWTDTNMWTSVTIADGTGFTANFTGINITGAKTVSLNGTDRTIGNITFTDLTTSDYNLSITGNILTLDVNTGSPTINVTQWDRTLTIGSQISGSEGLTKIGAGTLTLSNTSNNYTGGTVISVGTLAFGSIAAMPSSGAVALNTGANLYIDLGTSGDWTTGTSGVGTLGGLLAGVGGAGTSTVTYSGNVGLQLNVGADSTYTASIANPTGSTSLSLTKLGNNLLTLSNDNTFTGGVTVNAGTLSMSGANTFPSATLWGGALILSGDNAMTGAVNLNAGTLQLAHANAIDTATAVNAVSGTTLQLRSNTAATFATPLTRFGNAAGNMTINVDRVSSGSGNQLVLNGGLSSQQEHGNENTFNFTGGNSYTLSIPTLKFDRFGGGGGGGGLHLVPTTTSVAIGPVTSSSTQAFFLRLRGTSTGNTLGAITHTGGTLTLQKQEAGTWTLTGACNYAGTVAITVGSLRIKHNTALGTTAGGVTQAGASELAIDGSGGAVTVGAEALTINGGGISNAGALRNIAGTNTYGGTVTLAGQSRINSDSGTLLLNNATSVTGAGQNLVVGGAGNVTISGAITTTTGFVSKDSAGTLTLSGNNTYTGATTVNGGTLKLGTNNVIPNASAVSIATATLDADTRTDTAGTLDVTGAAVINLGSGATLAFADSKGVDWTGGTLNITGTLGKTSLRFGDSDDDLTTVQLAKISVNGSGLGTYILDVNGYLVPRPAGTVILFF